MKKILLLLTREELAAVILAVASYRSLNNAGIEAHRKLLKAVKRHIEKTGVPFFTPGQYIGFGHSE